MMNHDKYVDDGPRASFVSTNLIPHSKIGGFNQKISFATSDYCLKCAHHILYIVRTFSVTSPGAPRYGVCFSVYIY